MIAAPAHPVAAASSPDPAVRPTWDRSGWAPITGLALGLLPFEGMPRWEPRHLELFVEQLPGFRVTDLTTAPGIGKALVVLGRISDARIRAGVVEVRVCWIEGAWARLSAAEMETPALSYSMRWRPFELTALHVRRAR